MTALRDKLPELFAQDSALSGIAVNLPFVECFSAVNAFFLTAFVITQVPDTSYWASVITSEGE